MPWVALGAQVGSSLLGSGASRDAAEAQQRALREAQNRYDSALSEANTYQKPYYAAGTNALDALMQRLPDLSQGYDPSRLTSEPGYQFGLNEGQKALNGSLAARGLTDSGEALRAAARYGTDYATTKLNDAFARDRQSRNDAFSMLTGTAGFGERAGSRMGDATLGTAKNVAGLITGGGNVAAANDVSQGNIWGNLLNYGGATLPGMVKGGGGGGAGGWGSGMEGMSPESLAGFYADGGPVPEKLPPPIVGMEKLERDQFAKRAAVLRALDAAASKPLAGGAAAVANPQTALDKRMKEADAYADGGPVHSKTGGKADKVMAHLSGGEYIIPADVVSALGDGNSDAGHALLNELRQRVRAQAKGA